MVESRKSRCLDKVIRILFPAGLVLAVATVMSVAAAVPGPQFQVNTFTMGDQFLPAVGMNAAGQSVIVWTSQAQDGSGYGIFAQRYDANVVAQGPEFLVNTTTVGDQVEPAVVMDASGNFVIAWSGNGRGDADGVFARRYNASGVAQGDEFLVNTTIPGWQAHPVLAMNASGGFIVVWETIAAGATPGFFNSSGIFGRRYDASGNALDAAEFQINTAPSASRFDSVFERPAHALAMDPVGDFVVAWQAQPPSGQPAKLNARIFHSDGTAQGPEFLVNTSNGSRPAAAMDGAGNFVVVYEPGFGQLFLANGARQGNEFPLDTGTVQRPAVEMNAAGKFVAAWRGADPLTDSTAIFQRPFGATGAPEDTAQLVSDVTVGESSPAVKMDGTGTFLIAWTDRDASGQGVFARRYVPLALSINNVSVTKPASGTVDAVFAVTLSTASTQTVTVDFATADGTALSGSDYGANFGTLTFAPGVTSMPIVVHIFGDTRLQPDKTFFVNLSNPVGAAIVKTQSMGTILTNNALPSVSINDVTVPKPFSGTTEAFFTVSLSRPISQTVTVDFATANDTATAGTDYVAQTGTVRFLPGETTKGISIVINGGTLPGADKTFSVNLSNPSTAILAKALGVGTILNFQSTPPIIQTNEFQVNTTNTAGFQFQPAIGMNASGQSVIAWSSQVPGPAGSEGIFAQRFNADGSRAGSEFRVDDLPVNDPNGQCTAFVSRRQAGAGTDANGNFVIVWTIPTGDGVTFDQFNENYSFSDICAQRYLADGTPLAHNFRVDTEFNSRNSQDPSIGMYGNGDFIIAWRGQSANAGSILAKRFDRNGVVLGTTAGTVPCRNFLTQADEICPIVANSTTLVGNHPSVAVNPVPGCQAGAPRVDFHIVWNGGTGIFARGFDGSTGFPLAGEFRVSADAVSSVGAPVVGTDEGGNFVTVWEEFGGTPGIRARRFNNCSGPLPPGPTGCTPSLGNQFQANATTFTSHRPTVGMGPKGDFVVAWEGLETSTSSTNLIFARRFDANATPQGNEFRVNQVPRNSFRPAARMDGGGNFIVAFEGAGFGGATHIFADRFVVRRVLSIDDVRVTAGDSGITDGIFTVTLSAASNQTVTVDFATADGTALAGSDYDANSGTLTFAPGQIRKSIVVRVHGVPRQTYETFFVNLSNVTGGNATIARAQGVGTIPNDDGADLALTMAASPDPVGLGSDLTYTIVVTNNGPHSSTGVILTDALTTATMTLVSSSSSQGSCSGTSPVTCSLGTLAKGAQATVQIIVRPTVAGLAVNTASVTGDRDDPNPANNSSRTETRVLCTTCPNLEIAAIEVTQGIQFLGDPDQVTFPDNSVPLIQGKGTVVRTYFKTNASVIPEELFRNISGELSTFLCGGTTPLRPSGGRPGPPVVHSNNTPPHPLGSNISVSAQRAALNGTLNFLVSPGYTRSCIDLQVSIASPDSSVVSTLRLNGLKFEEVPTAMVRLYNIQIPKVGDPTTLVEPNPDDRTLLPAWLTRGYPISDLVFEETWLEIPVAPLPTCRTLNSDLTTQKWLNSGSEDSRFRYYGMASDQAVGNMRGCSNGIPAAVASGPTGYPLGANAQPRFAWDRDFSYGDWYGAHELGHTFGRHHVNATGQEGGPDPNYPYAGGRIGPPSGSLVGLDLRGTAQRNPPVIPSTWFDVMSYGMTAPAGTRDPGLGQWVSDYTYKGIKDQLVREGGAEGSAAPAAGTPSEHLGVFGVVNVTKGTVDLDTFYRLPNMLPVQPRTPGSYSISLQDSSGMSLAEFPFTPHPIQEYFGSAGDELAAITELVPYNPNTAGIVVTRDGLPLAQRAVSPHAPSVTMISPHGGESLGAGAVHVEWQASDADGDPLTFQVFFSADGGKTWLLTASRLTATQIDMPVSRLKGTNQGLFMVMASDGVNTGQARTPAPFVVPRHSPEAVISPHDDFGIVAGDVVILSGLGLDREDGILDNEGLQWTSSRDGFLGSGSTLMTGLLSQGIHLITLTATDSDGNRGTASIRVDVAPVDSTPPCASEVSTSVSVTRSGFSYSPLSKRYAQTLTLTNTGASTIAGPIYVVLDNLSSNATLYNAAGSTTCSPPVGTPYVSTTGPISAGATTTVVLQFTDPTNAPISYASRILAGAGNP